MSVYSEKCRCPRCRQVARVNIKSYGDYDPPDQMRELNPDNCQQCEGIKVANPAMFGILDDTWTQLVKERERHQKIENDRYESSFQAHELFSPFHGAGVAEALLKRFKKLVKQNNKHTKDKDGDWVIREALKSLVFECIKDITKQKK